jgi:hypothetical protein
MDSLRDWLWLLIIVPLWAISTMVVLALAIGLELLIKIQFSESLYTSAAAGGLVLAVAIVMLINCVSYIGLPFMGFICRTFGF